MRLVLGAAAAAGLASELRLSPASTAPSAIGLRCLVAGLAYLAAAAAILARRRPLARVGSTFAGLALVLYAADQLAYFGLSFGPRGGQVSRLPLLMTFDLLATAVLGLALVAWLLEGEREKQVHAADLARRRERAQACAYRISEAARTVWDLPALFRSIHESLGDVLPARNFYVALHDRASGLVSFPYFSDERDTTPAPKPLGRGLTEYVLRTGQPLLATPEVFRGLVARGEVELIASDSVDWLGAPLVARGEVIGVAAVQTYDRAVRLGPEERDLFVFVSGQIAAAIEAKRAEDALRQSETRLHVAIQQVPAVLWTTDEQLRFTSSLGAGLSALGLAPNQVVGMSLRAVPRGREPRHRQPRGWPCAASRSATTTSAMAGPSPCTSSPCATRAAPSAGRWGSPWTSPTSVAPTGPCASRKPGSARSSTSCRTSSSRRTGRAASSWRTGPWPRPTAPRSTVSWAARTPTSPGRRRRCGTSARTTSR